MIDLPFEGGKVEGSRKYRGRERVPKVGSRREETISEPINSRIGEFHTIVVGKCCLTCGTWPSHWEIGTMEVVQGEPNFPQAEAGEAGLPHLPDELSTQQRK